MPIVVSYEDLGNLGSAAVNAGFQSNYGSSYAQAHAQAKQRQAEDTRFLMGQNFQRQNMEQQQQYGVENQQRQQQFQAGQNEQERAVQQQGLTLRAQEQGATQMAAQQRIQAEYDLQARREAEAATNDKRDFRNKLLYEQLKGELGGPAADEAMHRKLQYESSLDQQKHEAERTRFANAAVQSGQANSLDEGGLLFDRNLVDKAAKAATPAKGRGAAGDLLGTLSGDVVQNAILAMKAGKAGEFMGDLEGKSPGRQLPYDQRVSMSAMYAAASNPNETTTSQVFRSIQSAQASGNVELEAMLQRALKDRVAFGSNQRSPARSGGPMPGMGGGASPPASFGGPKDPSQMTDEELMQEATGAGGR